jgi:hypothetical protein
MAKGIDFLINRFYNQSRVDKQNQIGKEMQRVPSSPHSKGQGIVEFALVLVMAAIVIGVMIYLLLPSLLH